MIIFVNTNDKLESQKLDVNATDKVGNLINRVVKRAANQHDNVEDNEVYLQDQDDDLDKGRTLLESEIENGSFLFVGKCKKVKVLIQYMGRSFESSVTPALTLRALRKKTSTFFGLSEDETADFQFLSAEKPIDNLKLMVGSLTEYGQCSVTLTFAPKKDINGFIKSPIETLQDSMETAEYIAGEMEGNWKLVTIIDSVISPACIFSISAKNGRVFYLRFDLAKYNDEAPTAQLWDPTKNSPLSQELWPNWSARCLQVFRAWGKPCIYLPCDRLAFEGHPNWPAEYPGLVWRQNNDSIVKYLNEVHQILN